MNLKMAAVPCVALAVPLCAQAPATGANRSARWQQDIDAFVAGLSAKGNTVDFKRGISSRGQIDFDKLYPIATFTPAIAQLKQTVPTASDADIILALMRIVAGAHVAHNSVQIPQAMGFEQRLPINFSWLADGMIVGSGTASQKGIIGRRVLRIGTMTPQQLEQAVEPYVSYENESWLRLRAPEFMRLRPVLDKLHLVDADGTVELELERAPGERTTVHVPFEPNPQLTVNLYEGLALPLPLRWQNREKNYWYRFLADSQTAYIQYASCVNDPAAPFAAFARDTLKDAATHQARRIVIDLRRNRGGDSRVIRPLMRELAAHPEWQGRIFVLIGPSTFSSALMNAVELKSELHATLAGEPAGGKPASYGEIKQFTLPNSGLVVQYTSKFFAAPKELGEGPLTPDIPAAISLADLLAGRDPVLQAAIQAP